MNDNEALFDLDDDLREADRTLSRGRQHPNDRETRREVAVTAGGLASIEIPTGFGPEIDRLLWPVIIQAKILAMKIVQANRHVPAVEDDVVAVTRGIVKLRTLLVPLGAEISARLRTRR